MLAQLTKILVNQRFPDSAVSGEPESNPEITVVSRTPFDGGEHLIVSAGGHGLVQLFAGADDNDILHDHASAYGDGLAAGNPLGSGTLHGEMPAGLTGRPLPGDWSNSPLVFSDAAGEDRVVVKVYRHLEPGIHPEVEVLSAVPSSFVPELLGHVTTEINGETYTLATIQRFLTGTDGFRLTAEHAAAQMFSFRYAHRFGETLRMVHDSLAMAFPTTTVPASTVVEQLERRLDRFVERVPELERPADWIRVFYRDLSGEFTLQRIHGDLHLGQTLFDDTNWKILDFEGDPAYPSAERRCPALALYDVAGLIRSLHYASEGHQAWVEVASDALLEGYGLTSDSPLLTACVIDHTFRDVVRETECRPEMVDLPMSALTHLRAKTGA